MRIHALQHVEFEDLANIEPWIRSQGHCLTKTYLWDHAILPALDQFDWLIIMGGPMNVYEEIAYPWLALEKKLIRDAISQNKRILGICLGAQLIADVLGGRVYRNEYKEIGWHSVELAESARQSAVFQFIPQKFIAFHWHGDTFTLPPSCRHIASSAGCLNQAFEFNDGRVVGLQFHIESTFDSVRCLIRNCPGDFTGGRYVQPSNEILEQMEHVQSAESVLRIILAQMQKITEGDRITE